MVESTRAETGLIRPVGYFDAGGSGAVRRSSVSEIDLVIERIVAALVDVIHDANW